jgi:excinuclease UvrABC nuclease subunit
VPVQKCSKFDNKILIKKVFIPVRTYTTLPGKHLVNEDINYIKMYENAFDMRKDILNENKGKSGIYMITNKLTNDKYIGQSIDISNRFKHYFNLSYIKSKDSFRISRALIKYGYSNFSVTILEYCDKSELLIREQYYFDKLNPQYNILKIAGSSLNSKYKEKTKTKIIQSLKEVNEKSVQKALSRKYSDDTKLKKSAVSGKPVYIYEKFSSSGFNLIGSFVSARRAGKFLGISGSTVIKYMNSGEIFKDRYKFSSK